MWLCLLVLILLVFLFIIYNQSQIESFCPPQLEPIKVYPNRYGSPHYSTLATATATATSANDKSEAECNWTYLLTRLDHSTAPVCNPERCPSPVNKLILTENCSGGTTNKSYIENYKLGPLVKGRPNNQTNCYQYVCPETLEGNNNICWRCGK